MRGPGEIPLRRGRAGRDAAAGAHAHDRTGVDEARNRVAGEADARADERRDVPPGAEVDIGVGETDPLRLAGGVVVRVRGAVDGDDINAVEVCLAAILAGQIE